MSKNITQYLITVEEGWDDTEGDNKVSITIQMPDNWDYQPATIVFYGDGLHGHYFEEYLNGLTFDFWQGTNLFTDLTEAEDVCYNNGVDEKRSPEMEGKN